MTPDGQVESLPPLPGFSEPAGADGFRRWFLEVPGAYADHFGTRVGQTVRIVNRRRIALLFDRARLEQRGPIEVAAAKRAREQRSR